jgi:hypothetical protein
MSSGGRRSTSWRPGTSGNPGGRPRKPATIAARKTIDDVKAAARELTPEALATLESVMGDEKAPPAARVTAANTILDRGWGKPGQELVHTGGGEAYDLSKLTDDELLALTEVLARAAVDESAAPLPSR